MLNDKVYNVLKWVTMIVLPALGTLYFTLGGLWNWPYGEQVVGTITAIATFFGVILGISTAKYKGDGVITLENDEAKSIEMGLTDDELKNKKTVTLKVANTKDVVDK